MCHSHARSSLRQIEYQKTFNLRNNDKNPLKIIQCSNTRWLSIERAVKPHMITNFVLHNYPFSISIMLPILSFHLSQCQRQISECSKDSLEICFLDNCDIGGYGL